MASSLPSLVRPTANRAVHLRITPRPSNIGESREIMRLVSQFGEVEHFKNMKYDSLSAPNTAIVIFKEEDAAQHCLKRSPIRFRMGKAPVKGESVGQSEEIRPAAPPRSNEAADTGRRGPTTNPFGAPSQTRALSTNSIPKPPRPNHTSMPGFNTPLSQPKPDESRIFQIQTNPARAHFRDQLNMSHFHGHFAVDGKSAAQQDLAKSVPILGLSDWNWRAEDKPWRVLQMEKERDGAFKGSGRRKSLMEIWESGQRVVPEVKRRGGGV
ncbi:hypothetical protein LTR85_005676 [Meristemomyces frigidus]|nr:hypothetical protein LTR85_005676 [Meristemomyces frigidus]